MASVPVFHTFADCSEQATSLLRPQQIKSVMTNTNSSFQNQLQKVTKGLLLMSESEAPLKPFSWESEDGLVLNAQTVLQRTKHPTDTPVDIVDVDCFFKVATKDQDWHSSEERETVKKFQALVEILKNNLSNLTVYRVGKRNIDVYIVGKTPTGDYVGLSTKVIET